MFNSMKNVFGFKKLFGVLLFPLTAIPSVNRGLIRTAHGLGRAGPSAERSPGLRRKGPQEGPGNVEVVDISRGRGLGGTSSPPGPFLTGTCRRSGTKPGLSLLRAFHHCPAAGGKGGDETRPFFSPILPCQTFKTLQI